MAVTPRIWDPLRRKKVALTPEERVRQWMIGVLGQVSGVPRHQMMSEVELHFGEADKVWRADILVYGIGGVPLAVVECKRPEVALTPAVLEQALRYNLVLGVKCLVISNGTETRVFVRSEDAWAGADHFLTYEEMLQL
ncbi:MAG: type I restriction enzyme HsdR N-terminal domain-containing protein [Bacteroidales bacterium]|nr:type I restriction enzyme HsdR N-terminal domain-containing protein [Bacteroidales bacterium]